MSRCLKEDQSIEIENENEVKEFLNSKIIIIIKSYLRAICSCLSSVFDLIGGETYLKNREDAVRAMARGERTQLNNKNP